MPFIRWMDFKNKNKNKNTCDPYNGIILNGTPEPTQAKERIDPCELSSDLHVNLVPHTHRLCKFLFQKANFVKFSCFLAIENLKKNKFDFCLTLYTISPSP